MGPQKEKNVTISRLERATEVIDPSMDLTLYGRSNERTFENKYKKQCYMERRGLL